MNITKLLNKVYFAPRLKEIELYTEHAGELQAGVLKRLVHMAANTEWGKKYDYASIRTYEDFKKRLPIQTYEDLLAPYQFKLKVEKGFYNADRNNPVLSLICKGINALIRNSGSFGFLLAPFIILSCGKERADAI